MRFKHLKIQKKPSKRLRLTPLRTHFKRGICSKHAHAQTFFRGALYRGGTTDLNNTGSRI